MPVTSPVAPAVPKLTKLLISVRSVAEAEICRQAGVDWIDVKEPNAGSLGAPTVEVAELLSSYLHDFPQRSAALGEIATLDRAVALRVAQLFPAVKVGLSNCATNSYWQNQLESLANEFSADLVPVIYADWKLCQAPSPDAILDWACRNSSRFLLIDTYDKSAGRLLDHLSVQAMEQLVDAAAEACVGVVLAGSLNAEQFNRLRHIPCAAFAVRGAVCQGSRNASIHPQLVAQWVSDLQ